MGPHPGASPQGMPSGMLAALKGRTDQIQAAGLQAKSMDQLRNAVAMIEMSLPGLPTGGPIHTEITQFLTKIGKHLNTGESSLGTQMTQLRDLAHTLQQSGNLARLAAARSQQQPQAGAVPPMPGV